MGDTEPSVVDANRSGEAAGVGPSAVDPAPSPAAAIRPGEPLSEPETLFVNAVVAGEPADLKRRPIRAALVRALLLEQYPEWRLPPAGLKLERAIIQGTLDLDGCTVTKPILIRHSRFEATPGESAIIIRDARLKRIGIHSSTIEGAVVGDRADIENGFYLGGGAIRGIVSLRGAVIGGALTLEGTEIGDGRMALLAIGIDVKGPLILRRINASGTIAVPRAHLASGIYADGARIAGGATGIDAESARIGGDVLLAEADIKGVLRLANARIDGRISADGLSVAALPVAVDAAGLDLTHGFTAANSRFKGSVILEGAAVGKSFRADGIEIDGGETAIGADVIRIGGNCELPRAKLIGELKLPGAHIAGQLRLTESRFYGTDVAIRGDGASIRGGVFLSRSTVLGIVRFPAAEIGNQFRMRGASIKVEAGASLLLSAASLGRDLELTDRFQSVGAVVVDQVRIAGTFDLRGSHLTAASIGRGGLPAPSGMAHAVGRTDDMALSLVDAKINRLVMPARADERPAGIIDLARAEVSSFEDYADAWPLPKSERARAKDGRDLGHVVLDGFVYGHLSNPAGLAADDTANRKRGRDERVAECRLRWLEGQSVRDTEEHFKPQAWVALSERLAQQGYHADAQKIDIARQRRERRSASVPAGARWQSRLIDWLALYGHNPWRTVVWMALIVMLFAGVWGYAARHCGAPGCFDDTVFVVRNKDAYREETFKTAYPAFHALAYSFDVFVPFVSFGYEDHWRPNLDYGPLAELPWPLATSVAASAGSATAKPPTIAITIGGILYVLSVLEALLGIVLTSLLVTGFTGLIRDRG